MEDARIARSSNSQHRASPGSFFAELDRLSNGEEIEKKVLLDRLGVKASKGTSERRSWGADDLEVYLSQVLVSPSFVVALHRL